MHGGIREPASSTESPSRSGIGGSHHDSLGVNDPIIRLIGKGVKSFIMLLIYWKMCSKHTKISYNKTRKVFRCLWCVGRIALF